jgi:hypothetical protein
MRSCFVLLLVSAAAHPVVAQQPAAPPCGRAEYRQFDFWIGTWDVFNPQGRLVGTNTIDSILGGCVLHEQWRSAGQSRGFSYNMFDRVTRRWHQTWVDNGGLLLLLDGELQAGAMVLSGLSTSPQGQPVVNRITWTPFTPDSLRQLWEISNDQGKTWSVSFDGTYVRQGGQGGRGGPSGRVPP